MPGGEGHFPVDPATSRVVPRADCRRRRARIGEAAVGVGTAPEAPFSLAGLDGPPCLGGATGSTQEQN